MGAHKYNLNNFGGYIMKKVLSVLALTLMIVGLTGCLDPQDDSKQRPGASSSVSL
jgi:hypothetical protein